MKGKNAMFVTIYIVSRSCCILIRRTRFFNDRVKDYHPSSLRPIQCELFVISVPVCKVVTNKQSPTQTTPQMITTSGTSLVA